MPNAIYPGGFDPITWGHHDIARRAACIFDRLTVAVYDTPAKNLLFTTAERVALAKQALADVPNVEVTSYKGLTVDFARQIGAKVVVRGLRALSDFEIEMQMAHFNRKMAPEIDLVCLMTTLELGFINASTIKDIVRLGGPVEGMVPDFVVEAMRRKYDAMSAESGNRPPSAKRS